MIVTAFTVEHSITLAAAVLGWVRFPAGPVEALILATIVATAIANLVGLAPRHRIPFAFTLGLIHGLGFANALADLGLAGSAVILPLAAFNVGVEVGQMLALAAILIVMGFWRKRESFWRYAYSANTVMMAAGFVLIGYQLTGYFIS